MNAEKRTRRNYCIKLHRYKVMRSTLLLFRFQRMNVRFDRRFCNVDLKNFSHYHATKYNPCPKITQFRVRLNINNGLTLFAAIHSISLINKPMFCSLILNLDSRLNTIKAISVSSTLPLRLLLLAQWHSHCSLFLLYQNMSAPAEYSMRLFGLKLSLPE